MVGWVVVNGKSVSDSVGYFRMEDLLDLVDVVNYSVVKEE